MKNYFHLSAFFTFSLSLILTFTMSSAHAQFFELMGKRKKHSMNFKTAQNLIIVPIYINGKGPFNFLLDTGVSQMVITDTTFLKDYDVKNYQTVKVRGYGLGENINAIITNDMTVRLGKTQMNNVPTAIFTEDIFNLSSYLGVRIYGILGYYLFNSFKVKINYASSKITFYNPNMPVRVKGDRIPILLRNSKPYISATIIKADSSTLKVDMLVDNGSSHPMSLESFNNAPFPLPATVIEANLGVGINGIINGHMGRIASLKIGVHEFHNVLSGFPEFNKDIVRIEGMNRNGSIGADILRHFIVTFDYPNNAMYLQKAYHEEPKFDHDMSGMEIYISDTTKTNRFFIARIEKGSPAEEAGLRPDDEIISVDFKGMVYYDLSDLTEIMKSKDGKSVLLEVVRNNNVHVTVLKLRRRI